LVLLSSPKATCDTPSSSTQWRPNPKKSAPQLKEPKDDLTSEPIHLLTKEALENEVVQTSYVQHMETLRAKATRGKFITPDGEVVRFHSVQHASNDPCEDEVAIALPANAGGRAFWGVYDGHAGGATSKLLKASLIGEVTKDLRKIAEDDDIASAVKSTFKRIDDQIITRGLEILRSGSAAAESEKDILRQAYAGSCALLAIFDTSSKNLRVAVTGDSRAVLGRYSPEEGKYFAQALSVDQNGKNPIEKARMDRDHPDEPNVINPRSGRVLGLAISRAFGDSRWKWPEADSLLAHEKFGGLRMRGLGPPGTVATPPYLTAEPEVTETELAMGKQEANADFMIMATDGFWDHISTENAVRLVSDWVSAHAASSRLPGASPAPPITSPHDRRLWPSFSLPSPIEWPLKKGSGVWGDWEVKPEDFVYEEHNAATHLVQNAFGGRRRGLFCGAMGEKEMARWARDDISVVVVFFGKVNGKTVVDEPVLRVV
jgi:pyruvate dehydrogenase phosphatase